LTTYKTHKLNRVWADDWEALYLDGQKVVEVHSLSPRDIFEALGLECEEHEIRVDKHGDADFTDRFENLRLVIKKK
jgi:hypothetical protein